VLVLGVLLVGGCTRESTRIAIETQRRSDEVQQAVFERQHEALCVLLYRDLLRRLEGGGLALSAAQQELLSAVWNDRDLIESWALQQERAQALRIVGVDAKLFGDQAMIDLLWKAVEIRADRARQGLMVSAVESATQPAASE
jgi:hypothetical protein